MMRLVLTALAGVGLLGAAALLLAIACAFALLGAGCLEDYRRTRTDWKRARIFFAFVCLDAGACVAFSGGAVLVLGKLWGMMTFVF